MRLTSIILFIVLGFNAFSANHDARYIKLKKEYTFKPDGSYTLNYEHKLEHKTYHSFHRLFGENFIVYNPQFQSLKINRMQTTMANGKVIIGPENAHNEVLPSWAANSGAYNHMREMVVTHTGLEIGAIVDLSYTIESQPSTLGFTQIMEPLRISMPVDEFELVFNVPDSIVFTISEKITKFKPVITNQDGIQTYKFLFTNLPATEQFGIIDQSFVPHIIAQTGTKTFVDFLAIIDKTENSSSQITNDQMDVIIDIQNEVTKIKTIPVPIEYQLFPVQNPEVTIRRNSGTPLEKTLVFQKWLAEKGIPSKIAFKIPESLFDENLSTFLPTTEILLVVQINNSPVAFSPVRMHKNNLLDNQGYVYVVKSDEGFRSISEKTTKNIKSTVSGST